MEIKLKLRLLIIFLAVLSWTQDAVLAYNGVPALLPMQGRLTDSTGSPVNYTVTVNFRIYPPETPPPSPPGCYIYEDTQTITPNAFGVFSVLLGASGNSTGPANSIQQVFNNDTTTPLANSCASTYTPVAGDWRILEIVVGGTPMPTYQTIAAAGFSINSEFLDGLPATGFVETDSTNVTQAHMLTLTNGSDASTLHNHDSLYMKLNGTNSATGNLVTTANIYADSATSQIGIGTNAPVGDLDIVKTSPVFVLTSTAGSGGVQSIDFDSGASQRAAIQSSESTDDLRFYTGSGLALQLDASQNALFSASLSVTGTMGLGKYVSGNTSGQEGNWPAPGAGTLLNALSTMGASAVGTVWVNSTTDTLRYWDGSQPQSVASLAAVVNTVTAGTGLSNSGTGTNPILNVTYGTIANTALQGNQAAGGDLSGTLSNLQVNKIQGYTVNLGTAPTNGQVLTYNSAGGGSWVPSNTAPDNTKVPLAGGTMTGALTFDSWATPTRPASPAVGETGFNTTLGQLESWSGTAWVSGGATSVTNVAATTPLSSTGGSAPTISISQATGSQDGYLASSDWAIFNAKQNALSFGNVTESSSDVLAVTGGNNSVVGAGVGIQVKKATTSQDGYLSSTDWATFNSKANSFSTGNLTEASSDVLTVTGGNNSVIGAGTSIQVKKATTSQDGFLSSTDWTTFNGKITAIGVTAPLASTGGTSPTLSIPQATTSQNGFLASSDWTTFNGKVNKAGDTMTGALTFTTWTTVTRPASPATGETGYNTTIGQLESWNGTAWSAGAAGTVTSVGAAAPLTSSGGGSPVISMPQATTSQNGYLASADWAAFNAKQSALSFGNVTESTSDVLTVTGGDGSVIGAGTSIQVKKATTSQDGYLSSTDWTTFNDKQAAISLTDGSVVYYNGGVAQDNSNFFYDSTHHRLGLGTTTPATTLNVYGQGEINNTTATSVPLVIMGATGQSAHFQEWQNSTGTVFYSLDSSGAPVANSDLTTKGSINTTLNSYLPLTGGTMTGALNFATWTTGTRPASPIAGTTGYNTSLDQLESWSGTAWIAGSASTVTSVGASAPLTSSGGSTPDISMPQATTSQSGYLASSDWATFNGKANSFSTGNLTESTSDILTVTGGDGILFGGNATVQVKKATTSQDGYLSSTDWTTFNDKQSTLSFGNVTESTSDVLTVTGGTNSVIGAGTSIQVKKATTSQDGYLSSTDWTTFNGKQDNLGYTPVNKAGDSMSGALTFTTWLSVGRPSSPTTGETGYNTTLGQLETWSGTAWVAGSAGTVSSVGASAPLTSSGGSSPDISMPQATTSQSGYLASSDWTTFNAKANSFNTNNVDESTSDVLTIANGNGAIIGSSALTIQVKKATTSQDGYLSSTDWTTFNSKENSFSSGNLSESTSDVLTVTGGDGILVGGNATVQVKKATTSQDGYLSSTDWTTFNNKGNGSVTTVSASAPMSVTNASTTPNVSMPQATTSQSGFLSSADWATFNGKAGSFTTGNLSESTSDVLTVTGGDGILVGGNATVQVKKATTSQDGFLSSTDWATFNGKANSFSTNNVDESTSDVLTIANGNGAIIGSSALTIQVKKATTSQDGYLSSTDWTTFNGKQASLGYTPVNKAGDSMSGALTFDTWITTGRPSSPATGETGFNTTIGDLETWNGTAWVSGSAGSVDSVTATSPLTNTGSASAVVLDLPQATTSQSGYLASGDWATFNAKANSFSTNNVDESTSDVLTISNGNGAIIGSSALTIQVKKATTSQDGYLTSTDWTTFSGKVNKAGDTMTGGLTISKPGAAVVPLTIQQTNAPSVDMTDWLNNAGTILYSLNNTGTPSAGTDIATKSYVATVASGVVDSVSVTAPLTNSGSASAVVLNIPQATTSQSGYLASSDWATFNGKENAFSAGNLTESTSDVLTVTGGNGILVGGNASVQVKKATTSQDGYLSSTDWTTFNTKQGALSFGNVTEATSDVLTVTGGTDSVIGAGTSIQVKKATTSQDGYLSSTDWTTFNSKAASFSTNNVDESTSDVLTIANGNGAIIGSSAMTIQVKKATTSQDGYLSSTDWTTFNGKQANLGYTPVNKAGDSMSGALTFDTWITTGRPSSPTAGETGFNTSLGQLETWSGSAWVAGSAGTVSSVGASAPLTSSGGSAPDISMPQATTSQSGYLASSDWATFNGKENSFSTGNLSESTSDVLTVTGGTGILVGGNATVQVKKATTSQDGFLSSTDWTTFNSKQGSLSFGNVTEATSDVLTVTGGTNSVIGAGTSIQVKKATTSQDGYLSSTDWTTFNSKGSGTVTTVSASGPLAVTNGSTTPNVSLPQATTSQSGYLASSDWATFNGKANSFSTNNVDESTSDVLTIANGTGAIIGSSALTIQVKKATTSQDGYLSSADWATFNGKASSFSTGNLSESTSDVLTVTGGDGILVGGNASVQVKKATTSQDGYLSSADWTTFNGKQANLGYTPVNKAGDSMSGALTFDTWITTGRPSSPTAGETGFNTSLGQLETWSGSAWVAGSAGTVSSVGASAPLTSSGGSAPDISMPQATTSQSGYLASSDWAIFNGKADSFSTNNVTEATSDVLTISNGTGAIIGASAMTVQVKKATTSQDGYLSSTDWTTFNSKGSGTVTTVSASGPLAVTNGSTTPNVSLPQATTSQSGYLASSDWATFNGKENSFSTGNLSESTSDVLTVTGGTGILVGGNATVQVKKATTSQDGFLSSTDWTTFNGKANSFSTNNVTEATSDVLTISNGTGAIIGASAMTVQVKKATTSQDGYLSSTDWTTFNSKGSGTVTTVSASGPLAVTNASTTPNVSMPQATTSQSGYLASSDWTTFNGKENSFSTGNLSESTSDVLTVTGGTGILVGGNATVQVKKATTSQDGFLSSTDWTTFNSKQGSLSFGNVTEATSDVLTVTGGTNSVIGAGTSIQVKKATTSQDGYLSSTDWTTFNGKGSGTVTTVSASGPLAVTNGSTTPNVSLPQATTSQSGYLASSDWTTFNGKANSFSTNNVTEATSDVLTISNGTGAIIGASAMTVQVKKATTSQDGYLSSADWATFNGKASSFSTGNLSESTSDVLTVTGGTGILVGGNATVQVKKATTSQDGFLSSTDWTTFNSKGSGTVTTVSASGPLAVTNGSTTPNVSMPQATTSQSGYLASSDWATFNGKQSSLSFGNVTESTSDVLTVTGGTGSVIGAGTSIQVKKATTSQDGYLSSTDWTTFNSKAASFSTNNVTEATSDVLTISNGTGAIIGASAMTVQVKKATTSQDGYLSSTDWTTFNSKGSGSVTTVSASGPLAVTNGSTTPNVSMPQATTSQSGYLASSDWATFNGKENSFSTGNLSESTSDVLTVTGGTGILVGGNATVQVKKATTSQDGFLSSTDWTTFNSKGSGTVTTVSASGPLAVTNGSTTPNVSLPQATTSQSGYLASSDWTTFNGKANSFSTNNVTEATSDVLTISNGTGAIIGASAMTVQVKKATTSQDGYLSSTDWTTFNSKGSGTVTTVTASGPLAVTNGSTTPNVSLPQATTSQSGYLASSDWTTFNSKQAGLGYTPVNKAGDSMTGGLTISKPGAAIVPLTIQQTSAPSVDMTDWLNNAGTILYSLNDSGTPSAGTDLATKSYVATVASGVVNSVSVNTPLTNTGSASAVVVNLPQATTSQSGYLASSDWTTFNSKESAFSAGNLTESTSDVLTVSGGSGILVGGNATVQVKKATTSQDGYLSSTDWTTFNGKQSALTLGSLTESTSDVLTVSGGSSAIIGAGLTLQVKQATTSQDGYLSSTDWTTFNGKLTKTGDTMSGTLTTTTGAFVSTVADSATAKAFTFNTSASYSTSGDDLLSIKNNGTQEWGVDHAGNVTELGTLNLPSNGLVVGTTQIAMSGGEIGIGTAAPAALLHVESSSYVSPQMILEDGMTSAIPAYPSSYTPALTVAISETTGSRPLYFGYVSGGAWGATLTTGACGAFSQMCVDMGNGGTVDTALENAGTTLELGGGADGNFTNVVFENSGTTTIGASGTAFTNVGTCTVGSFTIAAGANQVTCTGMVTNAAVNCSPEVSQGTMTWSSWTATAGKVTIVSSGGTPAASKWVCMFLQ